MAIRVLSLPSESEARKRNPNRQPAVSLLSGKPSSFLVRWGQGKIFVLRTYGCQANVRDSEILRSFLLSLGMKESDSFDEADLILFNTCAVRANAENHLYGEVGLAKRRLESNPDVLIGICGCVMQEEGPVKYVLKHFPFVRLLFGTNDLGSFYSLLEASLKGRDTLVDITPWSDTVLEMPEERKDSRESKVSAFVNIMYGCDKFCTYCIVPYTRGPERSRKEEDILAEVRRLKDEGYKQVTLLGQNVDAYGKDFGDEYAFAKLLKDVADTGIERIRFTSPYPSDFNEQVFEVMKACPNIMPSLHMPLQSGSDRVLKSMNRRYDRSQYLQIVKDFRKNLPDAFLTTDLIVGFPTETEEDFQETLSLVREVSYDAAYTFIFSPREGTPAARMKNVASEEEIKKRFLVLKDLIDELTEKRARTFVGMEVKVLFEKPSDRDPSLISGYEEHGKLVHVKGERSLIGTIRKVRILESHTYSLIGELC